MTEQQVRSVVERTFNRIVSQFPNLPAPTLQVLEDAQGEGGMYYDVPNRRVVVAPKDWLSPALQPQDLEAVVAHELGHWHWHHTMPPDLIEDANFKMRQLRLLLLLGVFSPTAAQQQYRRLPDEHYADLFAERVLGRKLDFIDIHARWAQTNEGETEGGNESRTS